MKIILTASVCLVLLASAALGQTSSPTLKPRPSDPNELVPNTPASDVPVITVQGLCERPATSSASTADCTTVITRTEFEKLVNTVQPNMPPAAKKQLATRYVTVLLLAQKAHELGLDKGPEYDEQMYIARLQLLAREATQTIQREAASVPESEISSYYQQHAADYKTISFQRIFVPKQKSIEPANGEAANAPELQQKREQSETEMKQEADKLHERAIAGEDFAKLQQEAYDVAGMKVGTINVKAENMRKASVPPSDASVFDLKPGEVSQVFTDTGGYQIYKVEEIKDLPLASVHDEIARTLQAQNTKKAFDDLQASAKTTLDEAYFATPAPPSLRKPDESPAPATPPPPSKK